MSTKIRTLTILTLAVALVGTAVIAGGHDKKEKKMQSDIVDTAVAAGSFQTLVAAVKAAGLVDALKGDGPLTVFAPNDEAFAKLPAGTVESLLKPENKDKLTAILTYHVVPGGIYAKDVKPGSVETLQGSKFRVSKKGGDLMVNQAKIIATDIKTSNGVIHVIDQVIMPPEKRSSNDNATPDSVELASHRAASVNDHGQSASCEMSVASARTMSTR